MFRQTVAQLSPPRAQRYSGLLARFTRLLQKVGLGRRVGMPAGRDSLLDLAGALLSLRGKASGPALASAFFDLYEASDAADRHAFLAQLHAVYPREASAIDAAILQWQAEPGERAAKALHEATESSCQKLIRTLNLAPGGLRRLLAMRTDLLAAAGGEPGMKALDSEFKAAFTAWFNAGFLELRRIGWDSPAHVLDKIIRHEAVHFITGWDELRRRVEPADRRCYGFFHPQLADEPLIFVEVALTAEVPGAIDTIIGEARDSMDPRHAQCAIFYSISNCQDGLRGVPFGNFLIKQVAELLRAELPLVKVFATLSPVPSFASWLLQNEAPQHRQPDDPDLPALAARYLLHTRSPGGGIADPVARFHLGNGARLEAVHAQADLSENGLRQSHGIMVNYVYDLEEIEANHVALAELDTVPASRTVHALTEDVAVPTPRTRVRQLRKHQR